MERKKIKEANANTRKFYLKKNELIEDHTLLIPSKAFFSLKEACMLKGLNYKTACNKPYLQPNRGLADGRIGGKKSFRRQTIIDWVFLTDEEIISNNGYSNAS